jgi:hypothetical protein
MWERRTFEESFEDRFGLIVSVMGKKHGIEMMVPAELEEEGDALLAGGGFGARGTSRGFECLKIERQLELMGQLGELFGLAGALGAPAVVDVS